MANTAEGAMNEIHSMLQKIVELTDRAYNDSLSTDDKWKCQDEVDELLKEIDQVANTTTFDGVPVLKGNPLVKHSETITTSVSYETRYIAFDYVSPGLPSWLTYDAAMKVHHPDLGSNVQNTDHSAVVYKNMDREKIYGNAPNAVRAWTDTLSDNYVSVMNFESITNATTKDELLQKLRELSGTGFTTTCSTCAKDYMLYFTSDLDNTKNDVFLNVDKDRIQTYDITQLMNAVKSLPDSADATAISTAAGNVADQLVKGIVNTMSTVTDHFVEFQQDADYPDRLLIYDWRDDGFNVETNQFPGKITTDIFLKRGYHEVKLEIPASSYELSSYSNDPIWIQASGQYGDGFPIEIPDITRDLLHMDPYSVFNKGEFYEYLQNGGAAFTPDRFEEVTKTRTVLDYRKEFVPAVPDIPPSTGPSGEPIPGIPGTPEHYTWVVYGSHEETYTETVRIPGVPIEGPETSISRHGEPSSIEQALYAIDYISQERGRMGAYENRMNHTLNANAITTTNLLKSESRIRDADMAKEMSALVKLNILEQAGQAMASQANQRPQAILQLLNG